MNAADRDSKAIVLIHGIHDFRFIRSIWPGYRYFRKLESALADSNVATYTPELPNGGSVRARSAALMSFLDSIPQPELHLVAHSMGGLDARYVICNLDRKKRVRSLATIATPHKGTAAAAWAINAKGLLPWLIRKVLMPGLHDLMPDACELFNRDTPDRDDVAYSVYAGRRPTSEIPWVPWRLKRIVEATKSETDGVVDVELATWGNKPVHTVHADHAELVGWSLWFPNKSTERPFDHISMYRSIVSSILTSHSSVGKGNRNEPP